MLKAWIVLTALFTSTNQTIINKYVYDGEPILSCDGTKYFVIDCRLCHASYCGGSLVADCMMYKKTCIRKYDESRATTYVPYIMSAPTTTPTRECFEYHKIYAGDIIFPDNQGVTATAEECQKKCEKMDQCVQFNWKMGGGCFLKSTKGHSVDTSSSSSTYVTGPNHCPRKHIAGCFKNQTINPGDIIFPDNKGVTATAKECHKKCEKLNQCVQFYWKMGIGCFFKSKDPHPVGTSLSSGTYVTGPKHCPSKYISAPTPVTPATPATPTPDGWIKHEDTNCSPGKGSAIIGVFISISLADCMAECKNRVICEGIVRKTVGLENTGKCWLRKNINIKNCQSDQAYTTYTSLLIPECFENKKIYAGDIIFPNNQGLTATAEECQKKCKKFDQCVLFNWKKGGGCFLKSTKGHPVDTSSSSTTYVTGPKHCQKKNLLECFENKKIYAGDAIFPDNQGVTATAEECQKKCEKLDQCVLFNWKMGGGCFLKSTKGHSVDTSSSSSTYVTGPKHCPRKNILGKLTTSKPDDSTWESWGQCVGGKRGECWKTRGCRVNTCYGETSVECKCDKDEENDEDYRNENDGDYAIFGPDRWSSRKEQCVGTYEHGAKYKKSDYCIRKQWEGSLLDKAKKCQKRCQNLWNCKYWMITENNLCCRSKTNINENKNIGRDQRSIAGARNACPTS